MIRNEAEYREAVERLAAEWNRLAEHRARLKATGLSDDEVKCVTDPWSCSICNSPRKWRVTSG